MSVRQPIRWIHRSPDDDVERVAQELLRKARAETAEEAPAAARERMWFRLSSQLGPRPRWRWLVPAAATACVLAVAAVAVLLARPAPAPTGAPPSRPPIAEASVVVHEGSVQVEEAGRWQGARPRQGLPLPAGVRLGVGARTSIELPRHAKVDVVGPAALGLREDAFVLQSGETWSNVAPGHGRFEVELGRYRVVVRGTEFWSAREGTEAAVCLVHGGVDVLAGDVLAARLAPGQGWRSSAEAPLFPAGVSCREHRATSQGPPPDVAPVDVAAGSDELPEAVAPVLSPALREGPGLDASHRSSTEGMATSSTVVSHRPETEEPAPRRPDSEAALGIVGARATGAGDPVDPEGEPPTTNLPLPERAPTAEVAPAPRPAPPPEPAAQPRRAVDRCREAPDRERCYREVADGADLTAQSALYRLGELRRDRGDRQGALDAWGEYRRRFGAGAFAEETDLAILEMRLRMGSPLARAAADRFLRLWPGSPNLAEVRGIRGVLRQRSGDHAGALDDYSEALGARISAARRDESLYGRAVCLDTLGRAADARAAYERYLHDLPRGRFAAQARAALDRAR